PDFYRSQPISVDKAGSAVMKTQHDLGVVFEGVLQRSGLGIDKCYILSQEESHDVNVVDCCVFDHSDVSDPNRATGHWAPRCKYHLSSFLAFKHFFHQANAWIEPFNESNQELSPGLAGGLHKFLGLISVASHWLLH